MVNQCTLWYRLNSSGVDRWRRATVLGGLHFGWSTARFRWKELAFVLEVSSSIFRPNSTQIHINPHLYRLNMVKPRFFMVIYWLYKSLLVFPHIFDGEPWFTQKILVKSPLFPWVFDGFEQHPAGSRPDGRPVPGALRLLWEMILRRPQQVQREVSVLSWG